MATDVAALPARTILTGKNLYLRPIQKSDADRSVAFKNTRFPISPERAEEWITDDLAEAESSKSFVYAIVRTADDVLVGSVAFEQGSHCRFDITGWVAPVFGARGQQWKAEALAVGSDWLSNELESPAVMTILPATDTVVIEMLQSNGFVITSQLREKCLIDGNRTDELMLTRFNEAWIATLGDPMLIDLPISGTGTARPSPVRLPSHATAPKNAVMVGRRPSLPETRHGSGFGGGYSLAAAGTGNVSRVGSQPANARRTHQGCRH